MKNLYILFLVFDSDKAKSADLKILELVSKCLPDYQVNMTVIQNSDESKQFLSTFNEAKYVTGDNSCYDFSGWQKGTNYLMSSVAPRGEDLFFYVNDSFCHNFGDDQFDILNIENFAPRKDFALGFVDDFPTICEINGISYKYWIRSNFFFLNYEVVSKLKGQIFHGLSYDDLFSSNPDIFWKENDILSSNFKSYISTWLFGEGDYSREEYRISWYRSGPCTFENIKDFQVKASAIVCEHYLSARLKRLGINVTNFNPLLDLKNRHTISVYEQMNMSDLFKNFRPYLHNLADLRD